MHDTKAILTQLFQDTCGVVPQTLTEVQDITTHEELLSIVQGMAYACDLVEEEFEVQ